MKQLLIKLIKIVFSDVRQAIIGFVALLALGSMGTLLYQSKMLLHASIDIITTPTPLWATILLALLCCVYIHLKVGKPGPKHPHKDYVIKYFTIGNYKWKTIVYKNSSFVVDEYPYCKEHDLKFICGNSSKYCPHEDCDNKIMNWYSFPIYEEAKSFIEKELKNLNLLP